jgi:hypothetical protein
VVGGVTLSLNKRFFMMIVQKNLQMVNSKLGGIFGNGKVEIDLPSGFIDVIK